jgi:methionyl aminopeptidase
VIVCKSAAELERMQAANTLVADVLAELRDRAQPGVTTAELVAVAERMIRDAGAIPAFKGYRGYPATLCISVNDEVVHGIPSDRDLREGDIVSLDIGARLEGFFGDVALTVPVGRISPIAADLLRVTEESLQRAIARVLVGGRLSDIGHAVQTFVEENGFSVVREFVATALARRCTKSRRSRTTASRGADRGWSRGWCWPSSRWSTWADRRSKCSTTGGRQSHATGVSRPTSSTPWLSRRPGRAC